jgi:sialic acid synthase SpsE
MLFSKYLTIKTAKGERKIGPGEPCFVIAEMSANHNQDFEQAKAIVRAAAEAGADAIKLQSYLPDSLSMDADKPWFKVGGEENPEEWKGGQTFYQLYQKAFTPREWHQPLKELAESLGLIFFSTPYADQDVDFLETLGIELYKIASYEATDIPFLRKVALTGKPIIMSIGFADLEEIELAVKTRCLMERLSS